MQETFFQNHPIRLWLIEEVYSNSWIFIDRWSYVHFLSGTIVGFFVSRYVKGVKFYSLAFVILFLWEIWENLSGQRFFGTEPFVDIFWDMVVGMLGAIIVYFAKQRFSNK